MHIQKLMLSLCHVQARATSTPMDSDVIYRVDFPPPTKSMKIPPCETSRLCWGKSDPPPNQLKDITAEIIKGMDGLPSPDAPWPVVGLQEHYFAYWNRLRVEAVRLAAFLYGCETKGRKDLLIARLIAIRAMLVSPEFLRDWHSRSLLVTAGSADPGPAEGFLVSGADTGSAETTPPPSEKRRKITKKADAASARALHVEEDEEETCTDPVLVAPTTATAVPQLITLTPAQFNALVASANRPVASGPVQPSTPTVKRNDFDAYMHGIREKVSNRTFTDPTALGDVYLETMELEDSGLHDSTAKALYKPFDPVATPQGVLRWISLCAADEKAYSRIEIADYIKWFSRVFWDKASTPDSRARYMKRFMCTHCAEPDWPTLMSSDSLLLRNVLHALPPASPHGHTSAPSTKPASTLYCYAYCDPTKTCNARGRCGFRHVCASCGGPHTAILCKAWIQKSADANMKKAGHK